MKTFKYIFLLVLLGSLFFLPEPDKDYLFRQSVERMTRDWHSAGGRDSAAQRRLHSVIRLVELEVTLEGDPVGEEYPADSVDLVEREIRQALVLHGNATFVERSGKAWVFDGALGQVISMPDPGPDAADTLLIACRAVKGEKAGQLSCTIVGGGEESFSRDYFTWYAILPPFVAIVLALLFQKTIIALFCGVWLGATLLSGGNPLTGLWLFLHHYFYEEAILDQFRLEIIGFVIALCAMVGVLSRGGGIRGFVNLLVRFARTVRSTQLATFFMGITIFFDDYSNCILVGSIMRPLSDRMRIAREKLAYIVDSTAAPIAGKAEPHTTTTADMARSARVSRLVVMRAN